MRISLHIGAHKTATTYIQARLATRAAVLTEAGVAFADHTQLRRAVSDRLDRLERYGALPLAGPAIGGGLSRILEAAEGRERLILSDENLAGPLSGVESARGLYPRVGARVSALLRALRGHDVTVFFSIRGYAAFYGSAYAYRFGKRRGASLADFRRRALANRRRWSDIVADICRAAGPERTVVWDYESFRPSTGPICDALTGVPGLSLFKADDRARLPSLSRKGVAVLEAASPLLDDAEYARFARVVSRFAFDPPDGKLNLFDDSEVKALDAVYSEDMERIASLGCGRLGGLAEGRRTPSR